MSLPSSQEATIPSILSKGVVAGGALSLAIFGAIFNFAQAGGFLPAGVDGRAMSLFSDASGDDDSWSFNAGQYDGIYNILSFGIACMGASTFFFFFQVFFMHPKYRLAMITSGLVTLVAFYHYLRIFGSFTEAYQLNDDTVTTTGVPFNDAYRYVDWLLTVPLLLCELILVMNLSEEETRSRCISLGLAAAVMVILGYPGEVSDNNSTRWIFWALAMIPFVYIVYSLYFGLSASFESQPAAAQDLVKSARTLTVVSWCTYPIVFIFPMIGLTGAGAATAVQVGYSVADIIAKPCLGFMCWMISARKTRILTTSGDMSSPMINN
jgi:bacteriorhodopsin